jgi:acetylglutamate kinase
MAPPSIWSRLDRAVKVIDMENTADQTQIDLLAKTGMLVEALPFMRRYSDKTILIKFGGHAMGKADYVNAFASDVALLDQVGARPVVVHGGGPQIGEMLTKLKIESNFVDGLRVTDEATISIVEMVLAGGINKALVAAIASAGGRAVGVSGKDGGLITARKLMAVAKSSDSAIQNAVDLGFVGEPANIDVTVLDALMMNNLIPVVAPVGSGEDGKTYNINADTAAGAISAALNAKRMLMLTDVRGVQDKDGNLIPSLTISQAEALILDGTVSGGMIPKVETCIGAVQGGAEGAVIMDGRVPHSLLIELFTEHGMGTIITAG